MKAKKLTDSCQRILVADVTGLYLFVLFKNKGRHTCNNYLQIKLYIQIKIYREKQLTRK